MNESILYEVKDKVAVITLNEPESRNAWSFPMMYSLFEAVEKLNADHDVAAGILTGNGPVFSAGANLKEARTHSTLRIADYDEGQDNSIYYAMMNSPKPIIAAVNGPAIGAGATMTLGCDIRIASSKATFLWPMASFGILPANGTMVRLARIVGVGMALELTLSVKEIDAQEANRILLVNRVVEPDRLMDEARELAARMAQQAPLSLRFIKEALYKGLDMGLRDSIHADRYRQFILYSTKDRKEASKAWLEKRTPRFSGE